MSGWDRTGVIVVPEIILDEANHLANCFESCSPLDPVFILTHSKASPPNTNYALAQPALRNSSVTAILAAISAGTVNRPSWDNVAENYLINLPQAIGVLASAVSYTFDPEDESIVLPPAQLWICFDITLQQFISRAGLVPI